MTRDYGEEISLRIGIHSGPVIAGVIGTQKPFYDVWGDTVNMAARMESFGESGKIQISEPTKALLEADFVVKKRGTVEIKGKGKVVTWNLIDRR
jgi:class 3 adenylate cyclase